MTGTTVACQTSLTKGDDPVSFKVIVYGKVDSLPPHQTHLPFKTKLSGYDVIFIPHKKPCSDSTGKNDVFKDDLYNAIAYSAIVVKKSGIYNGRLLVGHVAPCYTTFVALYPLIDTTKAFTPTNPFHYIRLVAGPKKLGSDFTSHFNIHWSSVDSVRINFVVQASAQ